MFRCLLIIDSRLPVPDPPGSGSGCRCRIYDHKEKSCVVIRCSFRRHRWDWCVILLPLVVEFLLCSLRILPLNGFFSAAGACATGCWSIYEERCGRLVRTGAQRRPCGRKVTCHGPRGVSGDRVCAHWVPFGVWHCQHSDAALAMNIWRANGPKWTVALVECGSVAAHRQVVCRARTLCVSSTAIHSRTRTRRRTSRRTRGEPAALLQRLNDVRRCG